MFSPKTLFVFGLLFTLLLVACGMQPRSAEEARIVSETVAEFDMFAPAEEAGFAPGQIRDEALPLPAPVAPQDVTQERLIIRTAELGLVVSDTETAIGNITRIVETGGGWVVNSDVRQVTERSKTGTITVRVPATGFNSTLTVIKELAVEVEWEFISGQDVTEEFVDLELRLQNLEATADRVRAFLDEAANVEDALAVNQELSRLEGEIERLKGRRQYLSQSAAFSTITISLKPDALAQPIEIAGWRPEGVARDALQTLINALQSTASFLIWVGIFLLPMALVYGLPIFLVVRFVRRRRQSRPQASPAETK